MVLTFAPGGAEEWFLQVGEPVTNRYAPGKPPLVTTVLVNKAISLAEEEYGFFF